MPFTTISPFWKASSPFTVLMSVDLPEPDGPQITTTSPFSTFVVQSVSTWKAPYHLLTSRTSIMGRVAAGEFMAFLAGDGEPDLEALHAPGSGQADDEEDEGDEEVQLDDAPGELAGLARRRRESP